MVFRAAAPVLLLAAVATAAGCVSGLPPALRAPRPVPGTVVLLRPAVALGPDVSPATAGRLEELLSRELAARLRDGGLSLAAVPGDGLREARERLLRAVPRLLADGPGKARGREAAAPPVLSPAREAGAAVVLLPLLSRRGPVPDRKGFLPRPRDELIDVTDQRRSWVMDTISRPDPGGPGLALRLLLVDARTGRVLDLRGVAEPAGDPASWPEAVLALARAAARELVPAAKEGPR